MKKSTLSTLVSYLNGETITNLDEIRAELEKELNKGAEKAAKWDASIARDPAAAWRRCFGEDYAPIQLKTIGGHRYHFSDKGVMDEGWTVISEATYYFAEGIMARGWKTIDKQLYYFHADGHKQECGRLLLGGKCARSM